MVSVRSSVRDTQGRSRVPELGPLGSMRVAPCKRIELSRLSSTLRIFEIWL